MKCSPFKAIRAVTFDVGGTLMDPWPSVGHVYAEVAARHAKIKFEPDLLNKRFHQVWSARKNFNYTRSAWKEIVRKVFAHWPASDWDGFFDALYRAFAEPKVWRVYNDVLPALKNLRQRGIRAGIVSNWDDRLRSLLARLDLTSHFAATSISVEAGACKPAPEIFKQVLARLQLPPSSVLHVGDSPHEDAEGASRAGLRAVLIRRRAAKALLKGTEECPAINSLTELAALLQD